MKQFYKNMMLIVLIGAALTGCKKKVENPKPIVTAVSQSGFVSNSKKVKPNTTLKFGFDAASNAETNQSLTKFRVFISGEPNTNTVIFDNTLAHRLTPTWKIQKRFDQAARESAAYFLSHPELQVEDPDYDRFTDAIIEIMEQAEEKVAALG